MDIRISGRYIIQSLLYNHTADFIDIIIANTYNPFSLLTEKGLTHVHLLLIMEHNHDKPRTAEYVDKVVSCEVPDKTVDPVLHKLVGQHMDAGL